MDDLPGYVRFDRSENLLGFMNLLRRLIKANSFFFHCSFQYCVIVQDCIERNMTKEETMRYVENEYLIPLQDTNRGKTSSLRIIKCGMRCKNLNKIRDSLFVCLVWNHLERTNPDLFIAYNARIRGRNARIPQRVARRTQIETLIFSCSTSFVF